MGESGPGTPPPIGAGYRDGNVLTWVIRVTGHTPMLLGVRRLTTDVRP
jgi:hypothetical protein